MPGIHKIRTLASLALSLTMASAAHAQTPAEDGVQDFGVRSLVPELDFIDEYLTRLRKHKPTGSLASPQVTEAVMRWIRKNSDFANTMGSHNFGEIGATTPRLTRLGAEICVAGDSLQPPMRFTLRRSANGGYFIRSAQRLPQDAQCPSANYLPVDPVGDNAPARTESPDPPVIPVKGPGA